MNKRMGAPLPGRGAVAPRLVDGLATTILVAIACWFALWAWRGDGDWLLGYINAGGFWWGMISLIATFWLALRRKPVVALGGIMLVTAILLHGDVPFVVAPTAPAGASHFRVVTASLRSLNDDMESAAERLVAQRPDVILAQETNRGQLMAAVQRLSRQRWNWVYRLNEVIACRCRIISSDSLDGPLHAKLDLPGGAVDFWNIHAPKSYGDAQINRLFFIKLADSARDSPAAVVAGDFNATPWNDGYRVMSKVAVNAWHAAGWGPGFTFPTKTRRMGRIMPLIRIDHVFTTGRIVPLSARVVGASPGADHFPVVVELARF